MNLVARETKKCKRDFGKLALLVRNTEDLVNDERDAIKKERMAWMEEYSKASK